MARRREPEPKPADWPLEKTLHVLRQQLDELQKLKGRAYSEARHDEGVWENLTRSVIVHGFGEDSEKLREFNRAKFTGQHRLGGVSEGQMQRNFDLRIEKQEAVLVSAIKELELSLPGPAMKGVYGIGEKFAFYSDLKAILVAATKEVFIIDNYLDPDVFELYVKPIRPNVSVKILTRPISAELKKLIVMYAKRGNFELRVTTEAHDRHVFVDGREWAIGQSIKDAAESKPTYMVEIAPAMMRSVYDGIWARAAALSEVEAAE